MVLQGSKEEETVPMETSPKNPFHNFTFPFLKWGAKSDRRSSRSNNSNQLTSTPNPPTDSQPQPIICDYQQQEGIDVLREKPTLDLKAATQIMKDAIFIDVQKQEQQTKPPLTVTAVRIDGAVNASSTFTTRNTDININNNDNDTERAKLSVQLSRKEIEEDYMVLVGHGPPAKPEERPKAVQKQLDTLFPGLWLREVDEDMYKIVDTNEDGKGKGKGKRKWIDES